MARSLLPRRRLDREEWIKAALDVLETEGLGAIGIEPLARKLGVTKGSFYWHFKDRDALLKAILLYWHDVATRDIIKHVEARGGSAIERLRHIIKIAIDLSPANPVSRLEIAIRAWAIHDLRARAALVQDDRERLAYLKSLYREAGLSEPAAELQASIAMGFAVGERNILRDEMKRVTRDRIDRMLAVLIDKSITSDVPARRARSRAAG